MTMRLTIRNVAATTVDTGTVIIGTNGPSS
jgi:hypothetical protein